MSGGWGNYFVLSTKGFGGTLDYAKAYGSMDVRGTVLLLKRAGWPRGIAEVVGSLWSRQLRWVVWEGHVDATPLMASCTPQGCPFGPIALSLWMAAGTSFVLAKVGEDYFCRTYMDDRTFVASTPENLLCSVKAWEDWSLRVGLRESSSKAQLTAVGSFRLGQLRLSAGRVGREAAVGSDFTVLGATSAFCPRGLSAKESQRVDAACRAVWLLGCLRLSGSLFLQKARQFGVSKLDYGWIGRLPPGYVSNKLWSCLRAAQRTQKAANRHLRAVIHEGLNHLSCLSGVSLLRLVATVKSRGLQWVHGAARGTPLGSLQCWFRVHGFQVVEPWVWSAFQIAAHKLRQGWRWFQWSLFCKSNDLIDMRFLSSTKCCLGIFIAVTLIWFVRVTVVSCGCGGGVGAMLSPAAVNDHIDKDRPDSDPLTNRCIWGCGCLGTHYHIAWECELRPRKLVPSGPIDARYGWVKKSSLRWLGQVQQKIWELRHLKDPP